MTQKAPSNDEEGSSTSWRTLRLCTALLSPAQNQKLRELVVHSEIDGRVVAQTFAAPAHRLVELARHILRELDPTPEQEILDTLMRIEARLQETESRSTQQSSLNTESIAKGEHDG